ncbi:MAG: MmcQ/YjbR family DNA-binding protein [Actinomycetales bacterium]|nr:MmcQ/YjbR family DNA-binding protein [Actinomycetales bacterium]
MSHPPTYDEDDPFLSELRSVCLGLPGTAEVQAWGRPTFRVGGRLFAIFESREDHPYAMVFRPEPDEHPALIQDDRVYVPKYFGPSGWLAIDFTAAPVDWIEIAELAESSYRLVAPAKTVAALDARRREA